MGELELGGLCGGNSYLVENSPPSDPGLRREGRRGGEIPIPSISMDNRVMKFARDVGMLGSFVRVIENDREILRLEEEIGSGLSAKVDVRIGSTKIGEARLRYFRKSILRLGKSRIYEWNIWHVEGRTTAWSFSTKADNLVESELTVYAKQIKLNTLSKLSWDSKDFGSGSGLLNPSANEGHWSYSDAPIFERESVVMISLVNWCACLSAQG